MQSDPTGRIMFPVSKRNADAAGLEKPRVGKRARRETGKGVTTERAGSPDYSDGLSDEGLLELLGENPVLARLLDGPAPAAVLDKPRDDKRARREAGNGATNERAGSPDYSDGISDDRLLELLAENPALARLVDGPAPAAPRGHEVIAASDDEYGSLPDLTDYQFEATDKGLSIEVDGYPVTNSRNLEDAAFRTLRDEFPDEEERRAAGARMRAKFRAQRDDLRFEVEWNTAKLKELDGKLTKPDDGRYDGDAYSRAGVEYGRTEGVAPVELEKLVAQLRAYELSPEYQDRLRKIFCTAGSAGQVHRPPPASKQLGLFDEAAGDELLIAGKPDPKTGRCLLQTRKQHTQEFGRNIVLKNGERVNETLDGKILLFKSLDGKDSLQPMREFCSLNDPARVKPRLKKHNVSLAHTESRGWTLDAKYHPLLVVRTFKSDGEPELTAMWPHREQMGYLTDVISRYGEKNVWLKTADNIYKHPEEYNRSEPDSAFRTFAQMAGEPIAWVRTKDGHDLDVPSYREIHGTITEHDALDAWILRRDGEDAVSPARLRELEPETYEATMHMVGLPPQWAETRSNEALHASVADEGAGSSPCSTESSRMPMAGDPAASVPSERSEHRYDERAYERSPARQMSRE